MRLVLSSILAVAAFASAALVNGCSSPAAAKCDKQDDCAADYSCRANQCVENPAGIRTTKGEFGSPCNALLKAIAEHPDCASGFQCFGSSPTDTEAYCSVYGCGSDSDCPGGFYCATVNEAPNVATYDRTFNRTTTVCKKRAAFCSPCETDVDCASRGYIGERLRCVAGGDGKKFCSTECANDANCAREATCKEAGGMMVCQPRAGSCIGDGSLCARCASDADCREGGFCLEQEYTKERSCTAKPDANGKCGVDNAPPAGVPWSVGCSAAQRLEPMKATDTCTRTCLGLRKFDEIWYLGCYAQSPAK